LIKKSSRGPVSIQIVASISKVIFISHTIDLLKDLEKAIKEGTESLYEDDVSRSMQYFEEVQQVLPVLYEDI
jgi:hypothetical protein